MNFEQWLNDLFRALGQEVAGLLPDNTAVGTSSITKAVKTLRAQRDEARVQAKKLTGKELGNLKLRDRLADTARVLRNELVAYQKEVANNDSVVAMLRDLNDLLNYIGGWDTPEDSFPAQKKRLPRAKHIGDQDFKRLPENIHDSIARDMSLHQAPEVASLEAFLKEVQEAHAREVQDTVKAVHLDSVLDENGNLKPVSEDQAQEHLKARIRAQFARKSDPLAMPDYGTSLTHPGAYVQGLDKAIPGTDSTGHVVMSNEDFESLQTVANSAALPMASGHDLHYLHSLAQAVQSAKPGSSLDNALALAAGDDKKKVDPATYAKFLHGTAGTIWNAPPDASDTIPAGVTPIIHDMPEQYDEVQLKILKEREAKEGDPDIELSWDGADEEDAVEPESEAEDDEQLF